MCVFKYHAFIYFLRPPPWYGTSTVSSFTVSEDLQQLIFLLIFLWLHYNHFLYIMFYSITSFLRKGNSSKERFSFFSKFTVTLLDCLTAPPSLSNSKSSHSFFFLTAHATCLTDTIPLVPCVPLLHPLLTMSFLSRPLLAWSWRIMVPYIPLCLWS
jgi:hypothetical protein